MRGADHSITLGLRVLRESGALPGRRRHADTGRRTSARNTSTARPSSEPSRRAARRNGSVMAGMRGP